jgi:putative acetyltransferase
MNKTVVRDEIPADIVTIRDINLRAFGQPTEADLVDALRVSCKEVVSLVAVEDRRVVGHILFTPVTVDGSSIIGGMGLGPMAVVPEKQRLGIGSMLVRAGLEQLKKEGCPFVVVLGHPQYYPRFGFVPASRFGLRSQWDGSPDEAFMVLELTNDALKNTCGIIRYRHEFDAAV